MLLFSLSTCDFSFINSNIVHRGKNLHEFHSRPTAPWLGLSETKLKRAGRTKQHIDSTCTLNNELRTYEQSQLPILVDLEEGESNRRRDAIERGKDSTTKEKQTSQCSTKSKQALHEMLKESEKSTAKKIMITYNFKLYILLSIIIERIFENFQKGNIVMSKV